MQSHRMKTLKFIHITKTGGTSIEDLGNNHGLYWGRFHREYSPRWHTPFIEIDQNLKKKYDWFTVIRNPYDRILSEFYCRWTWPKNKNVSINEFNSIIQFMINNRIAKRQQFDYHYTEQYKYIDDTATIHILRYENLVSEFNKLMEIYNINLKLNIHTNIGKKIYTINNFNKNTIELINKIY